MGPSSARMQGALCARSSGSWCVKVSRARSGQPLMIVDTQSTLANLTESWRRKLQNLLYTHVLCGYRVGCLSTLFPSHADRCDSFLRSMPLKSSLSSKDNPKNYGNACGAIRPFPHKPSTMGIPSQSQRRRWHLPAFPSSWLPRSRMCSDTLLGIGQNTSTVELSVNAWTTNGTDWLHVTV